MAEETEEEVMTVTADSENLVMSCFFFFLASVSSVSMGVGNHPKWMATRGHVLEFSMKSTIPVSRVKVAVPGFGKSLSHLLTTHIAWLILHQSLRLLL